MSEVLLPLALLGALIVSLDRLVRRGQTSSHLPSHRLSRPVFTKPGWSVELNRLSISIYTKALNDLPSQITRTLPRHVTRLYDIGAIVGIVGVAGAVFSGLWAVKDVWATVWLEAGLHAGETIIKGDEKAVNLLRRAMNNIAPVGDNGEQSGLAPLIPGVTVPLSHFPTIVLALVANQLFHELGHALSASYDGMSPSRLSFSLHYLLPSMIVSFPKSVDRAAVKVRLRLASAGSWHNLITYISIWSLALGGLGSIWWSDLSDVGRVVLSVDPASPLHGHLKPGQLITHLDEVPIGNRGEDIWSGYLRSSESPDPDRGWCILSKSFEGLPLAPCADHAGIAFVPINPEPPVTDQSHCLNPHLVLEIPSAQCPCPGDKWTCVRPHADENVLRIQLEGSKNGRGNFVLWSGDRQTVLEDVVVGTTKPIIFDSLVRWVALFIQYMSTIAFSLFIFNLLPLPSADGSHVFRAVLDLMPSRTPSPRTTPVPTQKPFQATLSSVTTAASPVYTSSSRLNSPNVPTSSRLNTPTISMFRQFELHSDDDDSDDGDGDYESDEENTGGRGIGRRSKEGAWKSKLRRGVEMGTMGIAGAWAAGWAMLALLRSS